MSVEFVSSEISSNEEDPKVARRRVLIELAQGVKRPIQVALDAETLLDGDDKHIGLYHWTRGEHIAAKRLVKVYMAFVSADHEGIQEQDIQEGVMPDDEKGGDPECILDQQAPEAPKVPDEVEDINVSPPTTEQVDAVRKPKSASTMKKLLRKVEYGDISHLIDPSLVKTTEWIGRAACKDEDASLFDIPDNEARVVTSERATQLNRLCGGCAVKAACLTDTLVNGTPYSIRFAQPPHVLRAWQRQYQESLKPKTA